MDPTVGVGLYRGDGKLMGIYYPENGKPDDESGGATRVSFELEQGGPYVVRPVINVMNYEFPASVGSGFESDAPYFYFEEENPGEKIVLTPNEQIHRVNIATNCEVEATTIGDWGGFEVTKVNNKVFLINVPERGGVHEGVNFQTFTATYKNEQDETVNDQHTYCFYQKPNYRYSSLDTNNTFISIPLQEDDGVLQIGEDFFVGMNLSGLEGDPEQGFTILGAKESHETDSPAPYLQEGYYTKSVDTEYTLSISISPKGFPWSEQVNMTDETLPYITGMFLTKKRVSKDYHFIRDEETGELKEELYDTQTDAFEVSLGNLYSTPSNLSRYDQFEIPYSLGLNPSDIVQSFYSYTSSTKGATNYYHFNPDGMLAGNITLNW